MPQVVFAFAFLLADTLALELAVLAVAYAYGKNQQRRAERRAKEAYNASLQDRMEMIEISADQPRTLVLGRARAVEGVRRRWVSGTHGEKLTMIVSFAGHQIDGFERFYFNDTPLDLDANGWVLTAPYNKGTVVSGTDAFVWTGGPQSVVFDGVAPVEGSISATWAATESVDGGALTVSSVVGSTVTLTGTAPIGTTIYLTYQTRQFESTARIRPYLGTPTQNVGGDLQAEYPGKIRPTDKFAGIALAVVDILYDTDVYPQGRPNVTALMRGALCYDPRKDSTQPGGSGSHRAADQSTWQWSENSGVCALRYATWQQGFALPPDEVRLGDIQAAADAGAVATSFTLRKADGSTSAVTLPRYRCGIVISSAADPRSSMDEILETMAGRSGWAGGTWRMRAGVVADPSFTLSPEWLAVVAGPDGRPTGAAPVAMSNGVPRSRKVNRVSGSCVDPDQRWQVLPFPAVKDSTLIASEGEWATEIEYMGVNHIAHAQHLASITIRESQAALRIEARCNMHAYACELFDVGTLLLPRYGMTAGLDKRVEVLGWRWHPTDGVVLQLSEIAAAVFEPVAELTGRDPAPDSELPAPGQVDELSLVGITSGTEPLTDGSVLTRTRVEWAAAVQESIRQGGQIEVQYTIATAALPAGDWPSWMEQGTATTATIPGLLSGAWYIFRVRALKPMLGVRGPWSLQLVHKVAQPPAATWSTLPGRPADSAIFNSYVPIGKGTMNADPGCEYPAAWSFIDGAELGLAGAGSSVGRSLIRFPGGALNVMAFSAEQIPINPARRYRLTARLLTAAGNDRHMYVTVRMYRNNNTELDGSHTGWGGTFAGYVFGGLPPPGVWGEQGADFGAGTSLGIPADVAYVRVGVWGQYSGGGGSSLDQYAQDVRLVEVTDVRTAKAAADAAATAAGNAQDAANTANTALAAIASDSVLTRGEKPAVILDYTAIANEIGGIQARAVAYGLTTLNAAYGAAGNALTAYLDTLSPAWNDLAADTPIVGTTFRAKFADVYSTRQAVLNAIAEAAGTLATWAGVSGAGKPASWATVGKSLGLPFDSWSLNGQTLVTVSDGKVGNRALRLAAASGSYPNQGNYTAIDREKKYRTRFWARPQGGADGLLYVTLQQFTDAAGTTGPVNGGRSPYKPSGQTRAAHNALYGTDQWGEYSHVWEAADWQAGVQFVRPEFLDNYAGTTGWWEVQDYTFEEVTDVLAAAQAATDAATAAGNAQTAANTANDKLAAIANDNVLTAGEKPAVMIDHTAITDEQAGIDARAAAYGITTERTAYTTAVAALSSYLAGLSPAWNNTAVDTPIVGSTFRAQFGAVYSTRQAVLNRITELAQAATSTKVVTFVQASAPTATAIGDLWMDTDAGNKMHRWSGSAWVALPVGTGGIATEAVTKVGMQESAGPFTGVAGAAAVSMTPAAVCDAVVNVEMNFECTNSSGSSALIYGVFNVGYDDGTSYGAYADRFVSQTLAAGQTIRFPVSIAYRFASVPAAVAQTWSAVYSDHMSSFLTGQVSSLRTRVELIYR